MFLDKRDMDYIDRETRGMGDGMPPDYVEASIKAWQQSPLGRKAVDEQLGGLHFTLTPDKKLQVKNNASSQALELTFEQYNALVKMGKKLFDMYDTTDDSTALSKRPRAQF